MASISLSTVSPGTPCLKELLLQFLEGKAPFYPVIEAPILQLSPLQISDDMVRYLDISSLQDEVLTMANQKGGVNSAQGWRLVLNDWRFVFKKVPNAHEFYFDIQADHFNLVKTSTPLELEEPLSKMVDDEKVRWNFEYRKRKELEEIIKIGVRGTGHRQPASPSKLKSGAEHGQNSGGKAFNPADPRTPLKTTSTKLQQQPESYILSGGKALVCPEILTIEELLDLPIPIFSKESIQKSLYAGGELPIGRENAYLGDRFGGDPYFRPKPRKDEEVLGKRGSRLLFDDVMKGLGKKLVNWDEFVFSQKTFEHLKERPFLLEQN